MERVYLDTGANVKSFSLAIGKNNGFEIFPKCGTTFGIGNDEIPIAEMIKIPLMLVGRYHNAKLAYDSRDGTFLVLNVPTPYNATLGSPA